MKSKLNFEEQKSEKFCLRAFYVPVFHVINMPQKQRRFIYKKYFDNK